MTRRITSAHRRLSGRGFTLLELMVVLVIVVLVATAVVTSVEGAMGVKTREAAGRVAGAVRAMYGEAVLGSRTCRLVFDLDEQAYWPECSEGKVRIKKVEKSLRGIRVEEDLKDVMGNDEDEERKRVESMNAFSAYEAALAPKQKLSGDVTFSSIWTAHQEEPYVAGQAYLYFFPHGQTEKAYLYVADGSDTYTIIVNPMTGRTKVHAEKIPVPDKDLQR